jgi:AcrR family transcriptional regulator
MLIKITVIGNALSREARMSDETVAQKRGRGRPPAANDTRERILAAAIEHFSMRSYDEIGLREIAAAARVDVAYVHRCFGSKKRLFAETVSAAVKPRELLEDATEALPETLARFVFATRGTRTKGLDIIMNSIASLDAGPVVRDFYACEVVKPLAEKLGAPAMHAAVIAAVITGVATLRNFVNLGSLSEPEGGELERLLAQLIRETARSAAEAAEGGRSGQDQADIRWATNECPLRPCR